MVTSIQIYDYIDIHRFNRTELLVGEFQMIYHVEEVGNLAVVVDAVGQNSS